MNMAITVAHTNRRISGSEQEGKDLLPGIPNQVTLALITTKLQWRDLYILSSVNRCWRDAIQAKEVYDERVRANATETLILHFHCHSHERDSHDFYGRKVDRVALYSTSEDRCYELPEIPWLLKQPALQSCEYIALDGKLYVLGRRNMLGALAEVYVLDLAGQRKWQRCTSLREPRSRFACGVMGGKIYVFGSPIIILVDGKHEFVDGCEVYDPQKRNWSRIKSITGQAYYDHHVAPIGKELLLYNSRSNTTLQVYNPAKNSWRGMKPPPVEDGNDPWPLMFVANEKICLLYKSRIDIYDPEQTSWINLHTHSFAESVGARVGVHLRTVHAVKDELFLKVYFSDGETINIDPGFLRCKGFNSEKKLLVWEEVNCSSNHFAFSRINCSIEL